jgi:hypothetical protein
VVVDADGQRKQTRPLAGVNGEVCKEKRKKLWKERKKDLTRASIVRNELILIQLTAIHTVQLYSWRSATTGSTRMARRAGV